MPGWQPNWTDVAFDHAAADEAAARCRATAARIGDVLAALAVAADEAAVDWEGLAIDEFETDVRGATTDLSRTGSELRRLADRIDAAAEEARHEQTRREGERDRWRVEAAEAERRRQRERAGGPV